MTDQLEQLKLILGDRYRIEREVGQGGMATVYLAEDLKHHRQVALKVLHPELSAIIGTERFLKEIEVTANLQHPNILPLYDSGEAEGLLYYVMPFVEGETLRDKLLREKQIEVEETVEIARSVAAALDYAHRHGIIHRDIKPENILVHEGQATVADFGIALAVSHAGGTRLTETGLSLGTPHYMSPEQATGDRELDARSDVYSLGTVVYEMLVGEPPHVGQSVQAIVAKILSDTPPPIARARELVPSNVDAAVRRALAKSPADRFHSAADFSAALSNPAFTLPTMPCEPVLEAMPKLQMWRRFGLGMMAVAVVAVVLALWGWLRPEPPRTVARYGLAFAPGQELVDELDKTFDVAPDGSWIVYVGPGEGYQLWVKPRDQYEATPLSGTTLAQGPSVSPDGEWIAYIAEGQLRKVAARGGASITVGDSASDAVGFQAAWLDDGTLVYVGASWVLRRVSATGGPSQVVWTPNMHPRAGDTRIYGLFPSALPGSKVLFTACDLSCTSIQGIWILDPRSGDARELVPGAVRAYYAPTGHVVFVRPDGGVFAAPLDVAALELAGPPVPVLEGVKLDAAWAADLVLSEGGTLLMLAASDADLAPRHEAVWVSRDGSVTQVDPEWQFNVARNQGWTLSPDGTRLAIGLNSEYGDDIWIKELDRGPRYRLTLHPAEDARPRWSNDGRLVTFLSRREDGNISSLYAKRADGAGQAELVLSLGRSMWEVVGSPNADWYVIRTGGMDNRVGGRDVFTYRPGRDSTALPLFVTEYDETALAISPDGNWLAYVSNESERQEVYVRPFPEVDAGRWQVSTSGGTSPLWAHGGRELFYVTPANEMVSAAVRADPTFTVGERRVLFEIGSEFVVVDVYTAFDISPDDQRFLMVRTVDAQREEPLQLILVENFLEELKEKVRN